MSTILVITRDIDQFRTQSIEIASPKPAKRRGRKPNWLHLQEARDAHIARKKEAAKLLV